MRLPREEALEKLREYIRVQGFVQGTKLAADSYLILPEVPDGGMRSLLDDLPCEDIVEIEYTRRDIEQYRVKSLYVFQPKQSPNEETRNEKQSPGSLHLQRNQRRR